MANRFHIALSFPGEHRDFVLGVAEAIAAKLSRDRVFYDEWYEAELLGAGGDLKLQSMYQQADLVVPFFSRHYEKPWCSMEWETIRGILLKRRRDDAVIPVHLDDTDIPGWAEVNFGIKPKDRTPQQIADVILEVLMKRVPTAGSLIALPSQTAMAGKVPLTLIGRNVHPVPVRPLLRALEHALAVGELQDSELAADVLAILRDEKQLELAKSFDPSWAVVAIRIADSYFTPIRLSAGNRDWQQDFAKVAAPILVGVA